MIKRDDLIDIAWSDAETGNPVFQALSDLVGIYVEAV